MVSAEVVEACDDRAKSSNWMFFQMVLGTAVCNGYHQIEVPVAARI